MRLRIALAMLLVLMAAAAHAADPVPTFQAAADTVRGDASNNVSIDFVLQNPLYVGLYPDSLDLITDDEDPGTPAGARHNVVPLPALARILAPVESGGQQQYSYAAQAPFEHGQLTFRLVTHDGHKDRHEFYSHVVLAGTVLGEMYPSTMLHGLHGVIEVVPVPAEGVTKPAPAVLMIHGDDAAGRRLLPRAQMLAQRGTPVLIVSQPGYGGTAGTRDWAGPATLDALGVALDQLKRMPGVDAKKLVVYGQQRGATAALLLAERRKDIAGVIAQSAEHDLWAVYRQADAATQARIVAEAGRDSAAWKARSPLLQAGNLHARLCVVHLNGEDSLNVAAGHALVDRLDKPGARVDAHFSTPTRRIGRSDTNRFVTDFMRRILQ